MNPLTNKDLKRFYDILNKRYWKNRLPKDVILKFSWNIESNGDYNVSGTADWNYLGKPNYRIFVDGVYKNSQCYTDIIILHEMVHIYLHQKGSRCIHGKAFMNEIHRLMRAGAYDVLL